MNENKPTSPRTPDAQAPKGAQHRTYRRPQVHDLGSLEKVQGYQFGYYNDFTARQLYPR